jgi:isocitrate/isopropylmalate dehydrogenase
MAKKKIIALGGDGVGPEVVDAACWILEHAGFNLDVVKPPCGAESQRLSGNAFPEQTRKLCDESDAILFGAAEGPSIAILVYLRWVFDNYINLRPVKYYPGAQSPIRNPEGIDFCIIRENSEGLYPGREGNLQWIAQKLADYKDLFGRTLDEYGPGKFALRIITEKGTKRIAQYATSLAQQRKSAGRTGKITCITKSNVLFETCGLFKQIVEAEVKEHSGLCFEHYYVDDAARRIIRYPHEFDVIITSNMFGDILADEAAEVVGGLGIAPSACLGGSKPYFEPVHGSAPDIAGKGIVNPTAMILSAKMMLDYFDMQNEANALENAVAKTYLQGSALTADQGGKSSTREFAEAVLKNIY